MLNFFQEIQCSEGIYSILLLRLDQLHDHSYQIRIVAVQLLQSIHEFFVQILQSGLLFRLDFLKLRSSGKFFLGQVHYLLILLIGFNLSLNSNGHRS